MRLEKGLGQEPVPEIPASRVELHVLMSDGQPNRIGGMRFEPGCAPKPCSEWEITALLARFVSDQCGTMWVAQNPPGIIKVARG